MKKSTLIILLTACVLIVAGLVICGIAVARGADIRQMARDGDFNLGISVVDGQFGGNSGYTVCENGEAAFPAAAVSRLDIGWVAGSVEISSYDGDKIQVTESASRALEENEKLRWKLEDGVLHLRYCAVGTCNMQAKSLTVLVPAALCLERLEVGVTSAQLTMDSLVVDGAILYDGVSGAVEIRNYECERLHIGTVSGEAVLSGRPQRLEYSSVSGGVRAEGLPEGCTVETDTVSGSVELRFAGCPGEIEGDSTSGSFTLFLPEDAGFRLDFDSVSGNLDCDFPSLKGVYGGEDRFEMDISTTSGDLNIRKN